MSNPRFGIELSGYNVLSVDAIWPDGDAPENPTIEDVKKAIEDDLGDLSASKLIDDWNLHCDVSIRVV